MPTLTRLLLVLASLLLGPLVVMADELLKDTNEIKSLTVEEAKRLAEFKGDWLVLNGLTKLDADTAKALAAFKGQVLQLDGLTALNADTAKALAEFKGQVLHLDSLTTLDTDTAKALAEFKGSGLSLDGLTTLDADTAKALAKFEGRVSLQYTVQKSFFEKNPLTAETALSWVAVSNGQLSVITALDSPDSVAIAQALATRKGPLSLPNLKKISPKTLSALIEKEDIDIPLIETLELIPEPDGSPTDDFVIPKRLQEKQKQQQAGQQVK